MDKDIDYKALFRSASNLFLLLEPDAAFTILDASDTYLSATLTKREEIVGHHLFTVFPDNPADLEATGVSNLRKSLEYVIKEKRLHAMPIQKYDIPLPGGGFEARYWNPRNAPVLDQQGNVIYIIHQVEDVTSNIVTANRLNEQNRITNDLLLSKTKFIEENGERINDILSALLKYTRMDFSETLKLTDKGDELDAIAAGLNALVEELEKHTRLLSNFNTELESANKELDSFSYSVSHDLRAPLRAINGYSKVLLEDYAANLDDEGKQIVDIIIRNAAKMGMLIDDLLTFSRVGKQNIVKVPLNMDSIVSSVVRDVMVNYTGSPVQWTLNALHNSEGDGSMINQVLYNLLSNAVKYSSKKEKPEIEVGSYKKDGMVIYYVKDNGAGFDMKYYDKLFGVFQRLHSSSEYEGTGVGLAMVQRIVRKHRGEVWATAELNKGATFSFSLPD